MLHKQKLPDSWPKNLKSVVIHIISLAHIASLCTIKNKKAVIVTQLEHTQQEINLLKEELSIKDSRMKRISPNHRPRYTSTERLTILELKAARGWSNSQAAETFMICPETLNYWFKMLDNAESNMLKMSQPVNKLPDFVNYIVTRLKVSSPAMGKIKIAQALTKAGLLISASTVARILKNNNQSPEKPDNCSVEILKRTYARYPNHIWNIDLTIIATRGGFWIRWPPFSIPQVWPFCWWVAAVMDQYSRCIIGFAVFKKQPTALQIRDFLKKITRKNNCAPKYIITDKGVQFKSRTFRKWCKQKHIGLRYGAVGKYGSIAFIERFFRTLKTEWLRKIIVPLDVNKMRNALEKYIRWYNCYRPHQGLKGASPAEIYEPDLVKTHPINLNPGEKCKLIVAFHEGDKRLPIIRLRKVA